MKQLRPNVEQARHAQRQLLAASGDTRTKVLNRLAEILSERQDEILKANQQDLEEAHQNGLSGALLHRLGLGPEKFQTMIQGVKQIAKAADPIGAVLRETELDTDLVLKQVASPLGVLLIIFESRPDAVIQIGSLTLRTANAVVMKGGREAQHSNHALVSCLRFALSSTGLPEDGVVGIEDRAQVSELLQMDDAIDLVIPRGSNQLVRSIQEGTRIPVLGHADGICHVYLAAEADVTKAIRIVLDGKTGYPSACNAVETLLVDSAFLPNLPKVAAALVGAKVELRADKMSELVLRDQQLPVTPAQASDFGQEFGDLILAIKTVNGLEEAIDHMHRYGSEHTEVIVTENYTLAEKFLQQVDAASVFHNASPRFADGFRYGLGAEVGISTGRIHARGPVGIDGLLTYRWQLRGSGQSPADYGVGKKSFTHRALR